jgi:cephalosporin hydroxylase
MTIANEEVPQNNKNFGNTRDNWRKEMAASNTLRDKAIELTVLSNEFNYGYQWEWCGVPIIRHPDDIVLQQEIVWSLKPSHIIETGVARGGSLVLSHSLIGMTGIPGKVLGLDIKILPHTIENLKPWLEDKGIQIFECDSATDIAKQHVSSFLNDNQRPVLVVLDSNHTESHVLNELNCVAPLLPEGSVIIIADTIIEEMPENYYPDRPWGIGNNPLTALNKFLQSNHNYKRDDRWSRRSLMGEFRDGIIYKLPT